MVKPSNFTSHPYDSVLHKSESETVARNVMIILSRTGDTFRPLDWQEYQRERQKDGNFTQSEHSHFDKVVGFCASEHSAKAFSPAWAS